MANNRLEMVVEVDSTGAVSALRVLQGKASETAEAINKSFSGSSFNGFAESIKRGIEDPLGAAGEAAKGFLTTLGPVGTGLTAAVGVMGAFAAAGFEAAKSLGEYADELEHTSVRMGLSTKEVAQFRFAMKYAGGDISDLERGMRILSQALSEGTEDGKKAKDGLKDLGIEARNSKGELRPMADIFVQMSEKLAGIEDVSQRNTLAIKVLGRSALEVLPSLLHLSEGLNRAGELGIKGPSPEEMHKWEAYRHQIVEFETEWAKLKRDTMQPIAATVLATWKWVKDFRDAGTFGRDENGNLRTNPNTGLNPNGGLAYGRQGFYQFDISGALSAMQGNLYPGTPDAALAAGNAQSANMRAASKAQIDAVLRRWGATKEGLDAALSEAKKNEKEALDKLQSGDASAIGAFEKAQSQVSSLEAKIKGLADARTQAAKVLELTRKYSDTAQDPIRKLYQDLNADLKGLTGAGRDQVEREGVGAILREDAKRRQKEAEEAGKAAKEMSDAFDKADATIREMMSKSTGFGIAAPDNKDNSAVRLMRVLGETTPSAPRLLSADQQVSSLNAAEQAQERIVQLLTGPGGEVEALKTVSAMRRDLAAQEMQIMSEKITNDLTLTQVEREKELFDLRVSNAERVAQIERDYAIQTLELRRKQEDDYVNAVKGGFQALISGGRSGLGSFIGSQAMGLGTTVVGNLARMSYGSVANSGFGVSQDSFFGKVLAGTPFVKAGDVAMNAAQIQYKAATIFAGAVGMGGPGNVLSGTPFGGVIGAVMPGGVFGGASRTNPFVFSAQQGTSDIIGDYGIPIPGTGTANSPALNGTFNPSGVYVGGMTPGMRAVGIAAAGAGAAIGTYQGIQTGGAKGAMMASGSLMAGAGGIISMIPALAAASGPLAPILAGVGLALGLGTMLFGDPKKKYAEGEQRMLDSARYTAPDSSNYTFDTSGRAVDYDYRGGMRTYQTITVQVNAMDAQSFQKFADQHSDTFAETIRRAIPSNGGLRNQIQAAVNP